MRGPEAIQNSLDNKDSTKNNKPVEISFNFGKIPIDKIPGYSSLIQHYNQTKEFWKKQTNYNTIFNAIDLRLQDFDKEIPFLQISDYNTTGMDLGDPKSKSELAHTSYNAFTRGNNSVKSNLDSGGSEGQGKATFFAASAIRTIFVHTVSKYGNIFEGITQLATHKFNNIQYSSKGFLNQNNTIKPDYLDNFDLTGIPFTRPDSKEYGSSISVLGLWNYDDVEEKMIKSLLNNFWMAVEEKELLVTINNTEINSSSLKNLITQSYKNASESSHTKSNPTKYGNPRPYFETWTNSCHNPENVEKDLPVIGNCTFKIGQNSDYPGKVAFFRKQKMLITRSSVNLYISKGYCGVFICNDENGNKILKKMEGKTHTEWDPKYCLNEQDRENGKKAIEEINKFISESWENYKQDHYPDAVELKGITGLNPNDLINRNSKNKRNAAQNKSHQSRPKDPYKKTGIEKSKFSSKKNKEKEWLYSITLKNHNKESKKIKIKINPSTDALRFNDKSIIFLKEILNPTQSQIIHNEIITEIGSGDNTIEFTTNFKDRIAMDLNIFNYED